MSTHNFCMNFSYKLKFKKNVIPIVIMGQQQSPTMRIHYTTTQFGIAVSCMYIKEYARVFDKQFLKTRPYLINFELQANGAPRICDLVDSKYTLKKIARVTRKYALNSEFKVFFSTKQIVENKDNLERMIIY